MLADISHTSITIGSLIWIVCIVVKIVKKTLVKNKNTYGQFEVPTCSMLNWFKYPTLYIFDMKAMGNWNKNIVRYIWNEKMQFTHM